MSLLSSSFKFIRKAAAIMLLSLLASSCQWMTEDYDCETDGNVRQYINITISVSADNYPETRSPLGGEYGDGTESDRGERENLVNNITLIFYQDNTGINTTSDNAKVLCVKKYDVHPFTSSDLPASHTHKLGEPTGVQDNEVLYTTGNQKLEQTLLRAGQSYKTLVVANANVNVVVGERIKDVRDKVLSSIYTGSGGGIDATNFVMTSESDATMILDNPTIETSTGETRLIYYFDCIHIERMAARIDYCTSGADYDATYGGYVYSTGNGDFYVVTKVTPFNLYNENEYLFKRVRDNWTDATPIITYLGDESTSNYVIDPKTADKDNDISHTFNYLSPIAENMSSDFSQAMNNLASGQTFTDKNGYNNVIIAYPRENTLMPSSQLMKYATGLAFEVKYYPSANDTPTTLVYYHYLRHQGEKETGSYEAKKWIDLDETETGSSTVSMNHGIVRNNIYRVSIESFSTVEGTITLKVEEEKWRHVDNPPIYI